jgi:DNA modification methylase
MLINGDVFYEIKNLKSNSIDLILIDPPYFISRDSNFGKFSEKNKISNKYKDISIDFGNWDNNNEFDLNYLFKEYYRILKKSGTLLIFYDIWKSSDIKSAANNNKFKQPRVCSWIKCLSGSTEIITKNSKNEIKKMFIKDLYRHTNFKEIKLFDGENWNKIHDIFINPNPVDKIEIIMESGEIIKTTSEHIFIKNDKSEIKAGELVKGDILYNVSLPESDIYHNKLNMLSDNIFWFIGVYLAEGSMSNNKIQISSNKNEIHRITIIDKLCSEYGGKYHVYNKPNSNSMTINVSSQIIYSILNKFISGNTSYYKHFSNDFFNLPLEKIKIAFISYLDSDGGKDLKNNRYKIGFTGKNRQLERDIRTICSMLNFRVNMKLTKSKNTNTGKKHSYIKGNLYLLPGKYFIPNRIKEIKVNKKIEKTNYFDISMSGNSNVFSLSSGVLVHNCNPVPINSNINYLSNSTEYFFTFVKGGKPTFNSKYDNGVYNYPICHGKERLDHPTQKPLKLIMDLIEKHSNSGDLILDTFAGTGTVGEACIKLNREYILIEKEEKYFNIIKQRLS